MNPEMKKMMMSKMDMGGAGIKSAVSPSLKMRKYGKKMDLQKRKLAKTLLLKSK